MVHVKLIKGLDAASGTKGDVYISSHTKVLNDNVCGSVFGGRVERVGYGNILKYFFIIRSLVSLIFLIRRFTIKNYSILFCHTLVVDGLLGYLCFKVFKVPYVILVRNSDLLFYYKNFIWLRFLFRRILSHAELVGFPSFAMEDLLYNTIPDVNLRKTKLWNNGIDQFWLDKVPEAKTAKKSETGNTVVFVGRFNENKNLRNLVYAIDELSSKVPGLKLVCVGGTCSDFNRVFPELDLNSRDFISFKGCLEPTDLINILDDSDCLCVPSFRETFGLVYVEALSRGVPVVCSSGQGVDGFFDEGVVTVDPKSANSISDGLELALSVKDLQPKKLNLERFDWRGVTAQIKEDLDEILL